MGFIIQQEELILQVKTWRVRPPNKKMELNKMEKMYNEYIKLAEKRISFLENEISSW